KIGEYDFSHAVQAIYGFVYNDFCDWYLEIVKSRLYGDDPDDKSAVASNLLYVLEQMLALAHPFVPFVTEEVWSFLPGERADLVVSPYPAPDGDLADSEAEQQINAVIDTVRELRHARESDPNVDCAVLTVPEEAYDRYAGSLEMIRNLSRLDVAIEKG